MIRQNLEIVSHLGKRETLTHVGDLARWMVGGLSRYRIPRPSSASRFIPVCYGNVCRSPFAEVLLQRRGFDTLSVGLEATTGKTANERAIAAAARRGVDLGAHRSTNIRDVEYREDDVIVFMEYAHVARMCASGVLPGGVGLMLLGLEAQPGVPRIYDPYGRPDAAFDCCFEIIEGAVDNFARRLEEEGR